MKFFEKCKDGGAESPVDAYFLLEWKNVFSIAILKFNKGGRENFHSHAFDALTWFISGDLEEERLHNSSGALWNEFTRYTRKLIPKFTGKNNLHRVKANKDSWCFTIRGRWEKEWLEYNKPLNKTTIFTNKRVIVEEYKGIPKTTLA